MRCITNLVFLDKILVPPAGIEPALREELDFESNASTSSAREARGATYYMHLS